MPDVAENAEDAKQSDWETPGTKKWFWGMRIMNIPLFMIPVYPLCSAVSELMEPKALLWAQGAGVHASSTKGSVSDVVVKLAHPTLYDYILLAGPGFICGIGLALICRALYRIEINFNGNQRPYTERDLNVLKWSGFTTAALGIPFLALMMLSLVHYRGLGNPDSLFLLVLVIVAGAMGTYAKNIYVKGRSFYQEMEKGV